MLLPSLNLGTDFCRTWEAFGQEVTEPVVAGFIAVGLLMSVVGKQATWLKSVVPEEGALG